MNINFKFFQISSIKFKTSKIKYNEPWNFKFNNHFQNFQAAKISMNGLKENLNKFKKMKDINASKSHILGKNDNWELIDTHANIELILIVLMKYGLNRDYIIQNIFGGTAAKDLNNNNEEYSEESLLSKQNVLFKMPISSGTNNKERAILIMKKEDIFPLFIDVNHHLFTNNHVKYKSEYKLETLLSIFFNNL